MIQARRIQVTHIVYTESLRGRALIFRKIQSTSLEAIEPCLPFNIGHAHVSQGQKGLPEAIWSAPLPSDRSRFA